MHLEQHDLPQRGQLHARLGGAHSSQLLDRDHSVRIKLDGLGHHAERALTKLAALVLAQLSVARGRPAQRGERCGGWAGRALARKEGQRSAGAGAHLHVDARRSRFSCARRASGAARKRQSRADTQIPS